MPDPQPVPRHLRTSRRWYDREGYEQPPAMVGTSRAQGERSIEVWCDPCTRYVIVGTDELPEDMPLPDIPVILRLKCSVCDRPATSIQMDVAAHYARCGTPTGQPMQPLPAGYRVIHWQEIVGAERGARLIKAWERQRRTRDPEAL